MPISMQENSDIDAEIRALMQEAVAKGATPDEAIALSRQTVQNQGARTLPPVVNQPQAQAQAQPEAFDAMSQMRELLRQKEAVDNRNISLNRGLLAEGQTSMMDMLRNPDQAQVNALLGAAAGVINPVQGQWGLTAAANGLGAFGKQREKEYGYAVDAQKRESESLKDRLSTINDMGKLDLKEREFGYNKGQDTISNTLARDEFGLKVSEEDRNQREYLNNRSDLIGTEQYINHFTGEIISLERAANNRLYRPWVAIL